MREHKSKVPSAKNTNRRALVNGSKCWFFPCTQTNIWSQLTCFSRIWWTWLDGKLVGSLVHYRIMSFVTRSKLMCMPPCWMRLEKGLWEDSEDTVIDSIIIYNNIYIYMDYIYREIYTLLLLRFPFLLKPPVSLNMTDPVLLLTSWFSLAYTLVLGA